VIAELSVASVDEAAPPDTLIGFASDAPDQYVRFARIADAMPAASYAARERSREVEVLATLNACIFAMPSRPMDMTTSATITSMIVKPR
jgi:hypothetical protein